MPGVPTVTFVKPLDMADEGPSLLRLTLTFTAV